MGVGVGQHPPTHPTNRYPFDLTPAEHLHLSRRSRVLWGEKKEKREGRRIVSKHGKLNSLSLPFSLPFSFNRGLERDGRPWENRSRKGRECLEWVLNFLLGIKYEGGEE